MQILGKRVKISIPSRIEAIDQAVSKTIEFASSLGFDESELYAIDLAVREAVANAVKHGNMLDESKKVEITLRNLEKGLEVKVRDFGKGFNVDEVPDPTKPENLLKPNGKGILFMRHFMEKVEWKRYRQGMVVKMLKFRKHSQV
ncbi:MAG: ATP-binding protein [Acidobacteria bacterium]|nr:MAG: ATP-binding protein [Acidobacteriota bacterium]GIU82165.1 MAG: anti-sigma factor [Pyrinomonadaceae bacterium]